MILMTIVEGLGVFSLAELNSRHYESVCVREVRGEDTGAGTTGELAHHLLASVHAHPRVPDLDAVPGAHQLRHAAGRAGNTGR